MAVKDTPTVQYSLAQLRKDETEVEVFRFALSNSKTITFPDIMALESEASDALLAKIDARGNRNWAALKEWLSADDAEALRAENLTRAQLTRLLKIASQYYQDAYGDLGNGSASASF